MQTTRCIIRPHGGRLGGHRAATCDRGGAKEASAAAGSRGALTDTAHGSSQVQVFGAEWHSSLQTQSYAVADGIRCSTGAAGLCGLHSHGTSVWHGKEVCKPVRDNACSWAAQACRRPQPSEQVQKLMIRSKRVTTDMGIACCIGISTTAGGT